MIDPWYPRRSMKHFKFPETRNRPVGRALCIVRISIGAELNSLKLAYPVDWNWPGVWLTTLWGRWCSRFKKTLAFQLPHKRTNWDTTDNSEKVTKIIPKPPTRLNVKESLTDSQPRVLIVATTTFNPTNFQFARGVVSCINTVPLLTVYPWEDQSILRAKMMRGRSR